MYDVLAMNTHVTQPRQMTKLPIKQYQSCTTPKIHRDPFPPKFWQQISQSQQNLVRMTYTVQFLQLWYIKVKSYLPNIIAHLPNARNGIV